MQGNALFAAAIFDMDGLLVDSERIIMQAWITVAQEIGITLTQADYIAVVGRAAGDSNLILTRLMGGADRFILAMERVGAMLSINEAGFPLKTGVLAMLTTLHEIGIPCAVASSSAQHEIQHRLSKVGVLEYFESITGADEVSQGKPNPAIYQLATQRLNLASEQCIVFEDSENGARAAISAGIKVIVVPDLKMPSKFVLENSFGVFSSLEDTLQNIPEWFCIKG